MKASQWSLFISGIFFGGVIDHLMLAIMKSPVTPYGIHGGASFNGWMALFDLVITIVFFLLFYKSIPKQ